MLNAIHVGLGQPIRPNPCHHYRTVIGYGNPIWRCSAPFGSPGLWVNMRIEKNNCAISFVSFLRGKILRVLEKLPMLY